MDKREVEDNLYPRTSMPQVIPPDQEKEVDDERNAVVEQYSVIAAEITMLEEDANFYESVNAISAEIIGNAETFMVTVAANQKAAASIRASIARMKALIEGHVTD